MSASNTPASNPKTDSVLNISGESGESLHLSHLWQCGYLAHAASSPAISYGTPLEVNDIEEDIEVAININTNSVSFESDFVHRDGQVYVHDATNQMLQPVDRAVLDLSTDSGSDMDEEITIESSVNVLDDTLSIGTNSDDEVEAPKPILIQIVGLSLSVDGRSCRRHRCCGDDVMRGDILRLVGTTVMCRGEVEEAIKLYKGTLFCWIYPPDADSK